MIKSGVPGLDEILKGGINEKSSILVTGAPGTGKSILALQFLLEGLNNGESVLFITTEETEESLTKNAASLGINIEPYKNKLFIHEQTLSTESIQSLAKPIEVIKKNNIKRVALDSITFFEFLYPSGGITFKKGLLDFLIKMKQLGVTLIVTSQKSVTTIDIMEYSPHEFLFEGLILVSRIRKGSSYERVIVVEKMRGQDHSIDIFPIKIGQGGMKVFPNQPPFSLIEQDEGKGF
ncbi:MAG TPA: ATPase domain-containing protein [Candidatus Nanoarchaeia archaeon]|nr:ATPase domain-containing protein [Candidatus Nanoarchaeia archaeon]